MRAVGPGAKAILTCRAEHFEFAKAAAKTLRGEETPSFSPEPTVLLDPPRFEIVNLEKLSPTQITQIIIKREGVVRGTDLVARILAIPSLADLAQRVGSIEFIIAALPSLAVAGKIDLARVFLYATRELLLKNIREKRSFTSMADKVHFLCELAWQMLSTGDLKINYIQFPGRLRQYRPELIEREIDHWSFDIGGQSLLIRDDDGNYSFSHKSLPEFFVAYKFAAELGLFQPGSEWITSYFPLARTLQKLPSRQWGEFFKCPNKDSICANFANTRDEFPQCTSLGGSCIGSFAQEPYQSIVSTFGRGVLTPEVLDFLSSMVEETTLLWKIVNYTKNKTFEDVKYSGGNAATLLGHLQQDFVRRNLKGTVLAGANLTDTDLSGANLSGADLSGTNLTHTILDRADLTAANLNGVSINELNPILSLAWSPDGETLAAIYSNYKLRLWSTKDWGRWREITPNVTKIRSLCWNSTGDKLYVSCNGGVGVIQLDKGDQFLLYEVEGSVVSVTIDYEDKFLAVRRSTQYRKELPPLPTRSSPSVFLRRRAKEVLLLEVESGKIFPVLTIRGDFNYPTVLRFAHEKNLLYVGRYSGGMQVFDRNGKSVASRRVFSGAVTAIAIDLNGLAVCGGNYGEIDILNQYLKSTGGSPAKYFKDTHPDEYRGKVLQIEINKKTGYMVILFQSGLDIWDQEGNEVFSLSSEVDKWTSISFDPTGTFLAVSAEATIHILDIKPKSPTIGKCVHKLGRAFSCTGMLIDKAKGLQATAPNGKGKLGEWLKDRGAVLKE